MRANLLMGSDNNFTHQRFIFSMQWWDNVFAVGSKNWNNKLHKMKGYKILMVAAVFTLLHVSACAQQAYKKWAVGGGAIVNMYVNETNSYKYSPDYGVALNGSLFLKKWLLIQLGIQNSWGNISSESTYTHFNYDSLGNKVDSFRIESRLNEKSNLTVLAINLLAHLRLSDRWYVNTGLALGVGLGNVYYVCIDSQGELLCGDTKKVYFGSSSNDRLYLNYRFVLGLEYFMSDTWSIGLNGSFGFQNSNKTFENGRPFGNIGLMVSKYL